jgi:anthranilate synthase component I
MRTIHLKTKKKTILADTITPVSVYLKIRDIFPNSILLEGSDYHGNQNSYSFICLQPVATFKVEREIIYEEYPGEAVIQTPIDSNVSVPEVFNNFLQSFKMEETAEPAEINGLFGYTSYDSVKYFDTLKIKSPVNEGDYIPEIRYSLYKFIIAINHFKNTLYLIENLLNGEDSKMEQVESLLNNKNFAAFNFHSAGEEKSNLNDDQYKAMVSKGKEHCFRGDVFQIVLSRRYTQQFTGDDFNVYRALRSINPSPYLYYFDYGSYKIFGSSPESQLEIKGNKVAISPIAGTFKRTGDDLKDKELAERLAKDEKENAEHVMLVDLARNDLSRRASNVHVERYKEVQYYSHVLHMVSKVVGDLPDDTNTIQVMADTFPAGTLSGAPKYRAMELIGKIENVNRGYYGGCIGSISLNGDFNQAIMIRSFMSKNNTLYYQAGAGIVAASIEENELNEVNNKLAALKKAIEMAENI